MLFLYSGPAYKWDDETRWQSVLRCIVNTSRFPFDSLWHCSAARFWTFSVSKQAHEGSTTKHDSKMITAIEAACVLFKIFCICVHRQHFRLIKISSWSLFAIPSKTTQAGQRPEKNGHFRVTFLGTSACSSCEDIVSPFLGSGTQLRYRRFAIPHPKWRVDDCIFFCVWMDQIDAN